MKLVNAIHRHEDWVCLGHGRSGRETQLQAPAQLEFIVLLSCPLIEVRFCSLCCSFNTLEIMNECVIYVYPKKQKEKKKKENA